LTLRVAQFLLLTKAKLEIRPKCDKRSVDAVVGERNGGNCNKDQFVHANHVLIILFDASKKD
jgi:hypothetical protein